MEPTGTCWCGCGETTQSYFAPGHDNTALHIVIREEYGTVAKFLEAHGYAVDAQTQVHVNRLAEASL